MPVAKQFLLIRYNASFLAPLTNHPIMSQMKRTMRQYLSLPSVLLMLLTGCGEVFEKTEMLPIDKVPEKVIAVAKEKLPGVTFDTAWTEKNGDKTVYEVRGKSKDGKTRDIKVTPDGTVLEVD